MIKPAFIALAAAFALAPAAFADDRPTPPAPEKVPSHFVFEEVVTLLPAVEVGETPLGRRVRIPITGGTFSGPGLSGRVLAGGADWQLLRKDGSLAIDADYMIETDDHVQIHVRNAGILFTDPKTGVRARWTSPVFEAPMGRYDFLNQAVFVSTLSPAGDKTHPAVRITIYRIGD
jgi:hypothetical protein